MGLVYRLNGYSIVPGRTASRCGAAVFERLPAARRKVARRTAQPQQNRRRQTAAAMADEKPKEGVKTENNEHINLKVAGQDGSVVQFKIKRHTPLSKLMKAYCERQGLSMRQIRFRFDGQPINETDTPSQLEMEDEDTIDVFQQQTERSGSEASSTTVWCRQAGGGRLTTENHRPGHDDYQELSRDGARLQKQFQGSAPTGWRLQLFAWSR
ncbi:unnamed protein product [Pleuronectes platessa]|uniref:Ubiquitin-like domain-containing protein n=1 Tax=Pleuronectes platessa TaxID=8262 RepID=A0A9N7W1I9_PLEPL|nr:unnamed protein product [Pleuronectes platessa]